MLFPSSKHILNAQVAIRAPCCKQWYDCAECHAESQDHRLRKTNEMAFLCKKCKKAFRKDMTAYEESDEYCPHCDNHYVRVSVSCITCCFHAVRDPVILRLYLSDPPLSINFGPFGYLCG